MYITFFIFFAKKENAKELLCSLMDLLGWIMTLWQWFTIHCNALQQQYYICICVEAWKQKTTCVPYYKQHVQTRAASTGRLKEVWRWFVKTSAGRDGVRQTGGGWEMEASEDKQGERLGSLVRCGEVVLGQREKGEAPSGEGEHSAEMIHFRAINLHFPWGNLWLCNMGNSLFADLHTEPPEHQIVVKEGQDLKQLTTISHFSLTLN